jgi:hypothetical protein
LDVNAFLGFWRQAEQLQPEKTAWGCMLVRQACGAQAENTDNRINQILRPPLLWK